MQLITESSGDSGQDKVSKTSNITHCDSMTADYPTLDDATE